MWLLDSCPDFIGMEGRRCKLRECSHFIADLGFCAALPAEATCDTRDTASHYHRYARARHTGNIGRVRHVCHNLPRLDGDTAKAPLAGATFPSLFVTPVRQRFGQNVGTAGLQVTILAP